MSLRALGLTLLALVGFLLIPIAACSSGGKSDVTANVNWNEMTPIPMVGYPSGTRTVTDLKALQTQAGFRIVLPSYLPQGIAGSYEAQKLRRAPEQATTPTATPEPVAVSIRLHSNAQRSARLTVMLTETMDERGALKVMGACFPEQDQGFDLPVSPGQRCYVFSGVPVDCDLIPSDTPFPTTVPEMATRIAAYFEAVPTLSPSTPSLPSELATPIPGYTRLPPLQTPLLRCHWRMDDLDIEAEFDWELQQPVPGVISSDMREEAMKVVTSMIEDPYVP